MVATRVFIILWRVNEGVVARQHPTNSCESVVVFERMRESVPM